jgi:hypothetical protein
MRIESKARYVVHEFAHETWGANRKQPYTEEIYEVQEVEALAKSDPMYARNNADTYALFATTTKAKFDPGSAEAPPNYYQGVE